MRSCGIVVEYNPFHNGHRYHAEKARELSGADVVVAVMSGNFFTTRRTGDHRQMGTNKDSLAKWG